MAAGDMSPWPEDYWWEQRVADANRGITVHEGTREERHDRGEQFGVPNPDKVMAHVNAICESRFKE